MKTKIKMNQQTNLKTIKEGFSEFRTYCKIKNLSEHTISFYENCYKAFTTYLSEDLSMDSISKNTMDGFILHLQQRNISSISVNTYIRGIRAFLYYCMKLNYLQEFKITIIKAEKKVKEIYTDVELQILLEKLNFKDCSFTKYKCWVIINLLLTIPVRASTLINIKIKNLDFESELVTLEKMKNRKQQILPMGRILNSVLLEYLQYRKADTEEDYLFPNAYDEPLTVRTLEKSLSNYNKNNLF